MSIHCEGILLSNNTVLTQINIFSGLQKYFVIYYYL
jgi:hypothetical protein